MKQISEEQLAALNTALDTAGTRIIDSFGSYSQEVVRELQAIQVDLEKANNQIPNFDLGPIISKVNGLGQTVSDSLDSTSKTLKDFVAAADLNANPPQTTTPPTTGDGSGSTTPPADSGNSGGSTDAGTSESQTINPGDVGTLPDLGTPTTADPNAEGSPAPAG